jgi:two-component system, sensor histidine kinase and response regulator
MLWSPCAKQGHPFSLILLDAQMPDLDGFNLAQRIKEEPAIASATIMTLTSSGYAGDAARCRKLGITVYLVKPIRQSELQEALLLALGAATVKSQPSALITEYSLRQGRTHLRILLAEDNAVNQMLAVRILRRRSHQVAVAANGREALDLFQKEPYDLVLMDVQMPELDGHEATALIRAKEQATGTHIPIVAMTANAMKGDEERCLACGMDAYIPKPIRADRLFEIVETASRFHGPRVGTGSIISRSKLVNRQPASYRSFVNVNLISFATNRKNLLPQYGKFALLGQAV